MTPKVTGKAGGKRNKAAAAKRTQAAAAAASAGPSLPKKAKGPAPRRGKTFELSERASVCAYYPTTVKQGYVAFTR